MHQVRLMEWAAPGSVGAGERSHREMVARRPPVAATRDSQHAVKRGRIAFGSGDPVPFLAGSTADRSDQVLADLAWSNASRDDDHRLIVLTRRRFATDDRDRGCCSVSGEAFERRAAGGVALYADFIARALTGSLQGTGRVRRRRLGHRAPCRRARRRRQVPGRRVLPLVR